MASKRHSQILTIATIRKSAEKGVTECLFNENHQVFKLEKRKKKDAELEVRLRSALKDQEPVQVRVDPKRGRIANVAALKAKERTRFLEERTFLDKPSRPRRLNLEAIDPTTFNIVDHYLKAPPFRLCTRIIPSYKKAREIFDYCAAQSCHLPGPINISPCIPFQYVRDGCYARAHKMRKIITEDYGYCCEKVFSFANQGSDRLAVTADKWGGCCVTWWYHVAPLVRVRISIPKITKLKLTLAMVIDPSMFDKPVLLTTWLSAQEKTVCDANANLSMYAIQPGSAYTPNGYSGTQFTTDPNYTHTDSTCVNYSNLVTC